MTIPFVVMFFYIYCFEFVLAVCPAMCSPRARGMLVVCSPCARDRHDVLVACSCLTCARRELVVCSVCSSWSRARRVLPVCSSWVRGVVTVYSQ